MDLNAYIFVRIITVTVVGVVLRAISSAVLQEH